MTTAQFHDTTRRQYRTSVAQVESYGECAYETIKPAGFDLWLVVKGDQDVSWQNTRIQAMLVATERNNTRLSLLRQQ